MKMDSKWKYQGGSYYENFSGNHYSIYREKSNIFGFKYWNQEYRTELVSIKYVKEKMLELKKIFDETGNSPTEGYS